MKKFLFLMIVIATMTMMMALQFICAVRFDRECDCGCHIFGTVLPIIVTSMTSREPGLTTTPTRILKSLAQPLAFALVCYLLTCNRGNLQYNLEILHL